MLRRYFGLTLLVCLSTAGAFGQDTATMVGTVSDTSGAVVPGAKVEVAQPAKGYLRELVSNSAGEFTAPSLPRGIYTVSAEAQGFQKLVHTDIALTAGQIQRPHKQADQERRRAQAEKAIHRSRPHRRQRCAIESRDGFLQALDMLLAR